MQSVAAQGRAARPWAGMSVLGKAEVSLFDALFPAATWLHRLTAAALFVGVMAGVGRARFYLPENPVPITLSTLGVLLTGSVLGWRWGLVSIAAFYLLGIAGVPLFQGGNNGWAYAMGATGGYLVGFILSVGLVGFLSQRGWNRGRSLWPMLLGGLVLYVPALVWLSAFDLGWPAEGELFRSAMYPYIPGDLVKVMLAALATGGLWWVADRRAAGRSKPANTGG